MFSPRIQRVDDPGVEIDNRLAIIWTIFCLRPWTITVCIALRLPAWLVLTTSCEITTPALAVVAAIARPRDRGGQSEFHTHCSPFQSFRFQLLYLKHWMQGSHPPKEGVEPSAGFHGESSDLPVPQNADGEPFLARRPVTPV